MRHSNDLEIARLKKKKTWRGERLLIDMMLSPMPVDGEPPYATLDGTYSDAARVVRVSGSYNTREGRFSKVLEELPQYAAYELSVLRDRYFAQLNPQNFKKKAPPGKKTEVTPRQRAGLLYTVQFIRLHVDRLEDLLKLCELRDYRVDGLRETILFLYHYWTCFYIGPQTALGAAAELNAISIASDVKRGYRGHQELGDGILAWKEDKHTEYNYRNDTLIKLLHITPEEQRELKTIISKEEKARRRADKGQWGHEKRDAQRREEKRRRKEQILKALQEGKTHREICKEFHCDFSFLQRLLAKPPSAGDLKQTGV